MKRQKLCLKRGVTRQKLCLKRGVTRRKLCLKMGVKRQKLCFSTPQISESIPFLFSCSRIFPLLFFWQKPQRMLERGQKIPGQTSQQQIIHKWFLFFFPTPRFPVKSRGNDVKGQSMSEVAKKEGICLPRKCTCQLCRSRSMRFTEKKY